MDKSPIRTDSMPLRRTRKAFPGRAPLLARSLFVPVAFLLFFMTGVGTAQAQINPAGKALLQKVSDTYYGLSAYQGTASVEVSYLYQGKPLVPTSYDQVEMVFKRPNFIKLTFSNPKGTRIVLSDGKNLYLYSAAVNQYNKLPTQKDTAGLLVELSQFQIQAIADPLYFLALKGVPPTLVSISSPVSTNYNGKAVDIVSGVTHTDRRVMKLKNGRTLELQATTLHWKWWVNKQTHLLEKMEAVDDHAQFPIAIQRGKTITQQKLMVTQKVRHTVLSAKGNPSLPANAFTFVPPPGATERKSVQELLKSMK